MSRWRCTSRRRRGASRRRCPLVDCCACQRHGHVQSWTCVAMGSAAVAFQSWFRDCFEAVSIGAAIPLTWPPLDLQTKICVLRSTAADHSTATIHVHHDARQFRRTWSGGIKIKLVATQFAAVPQPAVYYHDGPAPLLARAVVSRPLCFAPEGPAESLLADRTIHAHKASSWRQSHPLESQWLRIPRIWLADV